MELDTLFRVVDVTGVVASGLLGGALARSKRFDIVGFVTLAIITGLGGGMIRDVLLSSGFPVALTDPAYLAGALTAAVVAYVVRLDGTWPRRSLVVADVLALGCWSATGTIKAATLGLAVLPSIMLGVITAVGGGMLRDVLVGKTPTVFGGNTLYASLAALGSVEALVCMKVFGRPDLGMLVAILTTTILGMLARRLGWMLPEPLELNLRALRIRPLGPRASTERLRRRLARRRVREPVSADTPDEADSPIPPPEVAP
ncbi:trimeric intracellular cation channel family protein [Propioniciclava coleopterorum]|uniref:Trimeric intracellular cation channel family protein n=1 Tax=Propioniciclava coleopterorum TaxID=2714937 RepID=A0A6G7Y7M2_9ACTN|nr:trimeric intracellular cation channel family protein [Propioniciclava coleopterorum]QIK72815.1 trimeric intracellular cation channel family protein [Propioniciclava coleopterorum]